MEFQLISYSYTSKVVFAPQANEFLFQPLEKIARN